MGSWQIPAAILYFDCSSLISVEAYESLEIVTTFLFEKQWAYYKQQSKPRWF